MGAHRLVAPAGAPLPVRTVLPALFRRNDRRLARLLEERLGARYAFFASSGRAALAVLLAALREGSDRREVVMPAYTCFSVPSAVARAGLTIRLCDVDPKTLDLDQNALARLDLSRALCIVPSGLYGLPSDLAALEPIARSAGAALVDDAAQCLGATQAGKPCGTFGDAGFYSLGRGKGITTMGGGILVTRQGALARKIERHVERLPRASTLEVGVAVATSLVYAAMLAPSRYWMLDRLPFLGLGRSHFEPDFPIAALSAYQRRLAVELWPHVDAYNRIRRANAEGLRAGIGGVEGIEVPRPIDGTSPIYLRFPILARDETHRRDLLERLTRAGIGASASYPTSIEEIPDIGRHLAPDQEACPGARAVAARMLTLPTHPGVTPDDIERTVAIVRGSWRPR